MKLGKSAKREDKLTSSPDHKVRRKRIRQQLSVDGKPSFARLGSRGRMSLREIRLPLRQGSDFER